MRNILKQFMMITAIAAISFSCNYDDNEWDALFDHAADPSATYYVQFKDNLQNLEVVVVPATGETITEISTKIVVALMGLPLDQDLTVNLTVDPSSTATPNMYVMGATSLTIPAGKASASTTFKSVSANMPVGQKVSLVLTIDLGENSAPEGTKLTYNMLRPAPCVPQPGNYKVNMFDVFGDGWQTTDGDSGDGIQITLDDGASVIEVGMCSYWAGNSFECTTWPAGQGPDECGSPYCFKGPVEAIVTIPEGTQKMSWYFPGDAYGEIKFEVLAPNGAVLFSSGDYGELDAGEIEVVNCL